MNTHCLNLKGNNRMKYIWLLISFLCFSCSSKQMKEQESASCIRVNLADYLEGEKDDEVALSELVDSLAYIPLQTPDDLPMDVLMSVKMSSEYIFVLDRRQVLYRFDKQGRFLNLIGNRGGGPEEYVSAVDFEVDEKNRAVCLFDIYRKKIKFYQMSGAFMEDMVVPEGVESIALLNDSSFIGYKPWHATTDKSEQCVIFGKSAEVYETVTFGLDENVRRIKIDLFRMPDFNRVSDASRFRIPFEPSIYMISDSFKITKEIEFEMGSHLLPLEVSMNNELYNRSLNSSYVFELQASGKAGLIFMSFFYQKKHYRVIYDIVAEKFYTVFVGREPEGIMNDLDGGASFWPMWYSSDKMIGVITPDALEMEYADSSIKELYDEFSEYDNPVLQIVYVRQRR